MDANITVLEVLTGAAIAFSLPGHRGGESVGAVMREEIQAFLQACQSFTGFALYNGLATAEREAIATVVRTLARDFKPSLGDQPHSYLPVDG